jgi:hypothetical protein
MPVALILAVHYQPCHRWLHLGWETKYIDDDNIVLLLRHAKALVVFAKASIYEGAGRSSMGSADEVENCVEKDCLYHSSDPDATSTKEYKPINRYLNDKL